MIAYQSPPNIKMIVISTVKNQANPLIYKIMVKKSITLQMKHAKKSKLF
ncbi:hypothetical protein MTBBW1_600034 [Desulfamplus magnetovallimortis]|uniref:Uncharacterized protein n=1 Tax=Desulfamplus magnetovallimortis TaxID=1246637 RepID=A0A1W1HIA4_9BACT|nr:hypothetical protein MTBBW1_600034 [Desulfamplus magnetovallimortis]